ncbi:hypothetical protein HON36_03035 [Candidatus Parcubacteria bacterium]|jgi:inhibitor of cysteine peptidase|nr:hypothetical protein [Candidatus Parcubacteria bacterium]MBT7228935.1 hypothetical protein [Candidatus Parcubacteria bacterium]
MKKTTKTTRKKAVPRTKKAKKKLFLGRFGHTQVLVMILILFSAVCLAWIATGGLFDTDSKLKVKKGHIKNIQKQNIAPGLKSFASQEDFLAYLEEGDEMRSFMYGGMASPRAEFVQEADIAFDSALKSNGSAEFGFDDGAGGAGRVSETNVQVANIDEPDIVKTDGQHIFYTGEQYYYYAEPLIDVDISSEDIYLPPNYQQPRVNLINAWPVKDLNLDGIIPAKGGQLLLEEDTLLVFYGQEITAYNVSETTDPTQLWNIKLDNNTSIVTSRLYDEELYLVTKNYINRSQPCPFNPVVGGPEVRCLDIYHPAAALPIDTTFTAMKIEIDSGDIKNTASLVGMGYTSTVYMSTESLYITYNHQMNMFDFLFDFLTSEGADLMPADILAKLDKLKGYDLNATTKMMEIEIVLDEWQQSLAEAERMLVENEMENRMSDYFEKNKRKLLKTEIVKIDLDKFKVDSNGMVPGYPLNQFSLDEYKGNLRIATTIGENFNFRTSDSSANDVYVLNDDLQIIGSVQDMGLGEKIYSARFIGDKAYLVTFRQIDPFYVLDLSDPKNPEIKGELKIPGFSSYLHPISDDIILGIGEEDREVKVSLFDVSDPNNPTEVDKYQLDEYDSEVLRNHHAFLLDKDHEVFFMPGGKGGYVFSYENNELKLVKVVAMNNVKRAIYLDDYMYILGADEITVLNENDWEEVNALDIEEAYKELQK